MENINNLNNYYKELCTILNQNGFRHKMKLRGEIEEFDYSVDDEMPEATITEIAENKNAFNFLIDNGMIKTDICHFCGKYPIENKYTFTEPTNKFAFCICTSCNSKGTQAQETFGISSKKKSGCLSTIALFLFILVFFIGLMLK